MKKKGIENPKTALRKRVPVFSLKYRDRPAMRMIKPIANDIMARKRKLILTFIFEPLVYLLPLCRLNFFLSVYVCNRMYVIDNRGRRREVRSGKVLGFGFWGVEFYPTNRKLPSTDH
jgi:hypothetical protein